MRAKETLLAAAGFFALSTGSTTLGSPAPWATSRPSGFELPRTHNVALTSSTSKLRPPQAAERLRAVACDFHHRAPDGRVDQMLG